MRNIELAACRCSAVLAGVHGSIGDWMEQRAWQHEASFLSSIRTSVRERVLFEITIC